MRVLVIDDSQMIRENLKNLIIKAGCKFVGEAIDGEQGLEKYKELKPDLVILDITMPKKCGIECLEDIKKFDENAKVIISSAVGMRTVVMNAIKLGAIDYITKPFEEEDLVQK